MRRLLLSAARRAMLADAGLISGRGEAALLPPHYALTGRPAFAPPRLLGGWRPWAAASAPTTPPPPGGDHATAGAAAEAAPSGSGAGGAGGAGGGDEELSDGGAPPSPEELAAALAEQEAELVKARAEADALRDRVARTLADMENLRARTSRQAADARAFAVQGLVRAVLDVADNLERAGAAAAAAVGEGEGGGAGGGGGGGAAAPPPPVDPAAALASLREGVALTERVLQAAFRGAGVEKFAPSPGDAFDPNEQAALFEVPAPPGVEAGCVAVVTKAGYKLNGRIVRPAEVGVARGVGG